MSTVMADQITPQWQNYLDIDNDVKPYLQIPTASISADSTLQLIVSMACTWVQNYLGRPVAPTTFFRRFSGYTGWNGSYLTLPYCPVLEIVALTEFWGLNGEHSLVYQTPEAQGGPGEEMYQVDWLRGTVVRTFQGLIQRPFFPGSSNIECTWVAGYNPVPADIRMATLRIVKQWWNEDQQASRSAPVPLPVGGDRYAEPATQGMFVGIPAETAALLSPYLQQGIG